MATILGLAMKITADASGLPASLTPVEKALANLGKQTQASAALFDQFLTSTTGAADAQANVARQFEALNSALQAGEITAQDFAGAFSAIQQSAQETARLFQEGASTTARYRTETESVALEVERLNQQLKVGAIDQGTYQRAIADVTGENKRAADAERERQQFLQRAAELTRNVISPMEQYDATVRELNTHLAAGTITQETYDRSLAAATKQFTSAESAAQGYDKAAEGAGKAGTLAFNELSGILAAIPGPIGNIAGRLSGLSSAAEGLGRVFSADLSNGFAAIGSSVAQLANPFTLAVAGIAAFGAAASAISNGLSALSGRIEQLQNTASRLGTTFEFVQVLEEAAKRSGVAVDQLATGLQKFAVNVDKAREGGNTAAAAFDRLGISQEELQNTDPTELAGRVADALDGIEDPAERARIATELLGKSGLELLPAFRTVDDAQAALTRFSASIDNVDVDRLAGVDDSFDDIKTALQGLSQNLLVPFAGLADGVASAIADAIGGFTNLLEPFLDRIQPFLDAIGEGFTLAGEIIYDAATTAGTVLESLFSVIERLGAIVGAAVGETLNYFGDLLTQFSEFTGLGGVIAGVASAIAGAFQGLWDGIKNVVSTVGGFIEQVLQFAEDWLGIGRGIDEANDSYEKQRQIVDKTAESVEEKSRKEQEAAKKAIEANEQIVDSLLEQQRIEEEFGGSNERFKAAQAVAAVEQEIARTREAVETARAAGDTEAERAGMERLAQLDQIQAQQEDIASGAKAAREEAAKDADAAIKAQEKADAEQRQREEQMAKDRVAEDKRVADEKRKLDEAREKALKTAAKEINDVEVKFAKARFEEEKKRIAQLKELRRGAIEIGDVRGGGADVFLDLLGGREDAAVAEYKKQLSELQAIREELRRAQAKKAEILKGVG